MNAQGPYTGTYAGFFNWSQDIRNNDPSWINAQRLSASCMRRGYNVVHVTEQEVGITPGMSLQEASQKAKTWFDDWISAVEDDDSVNGNPLFIFGYFGHGAKSSRLCGDGDDDWYYPHVLAGNASGSMEFDITILQEHFKDMFDYDFLNIIECCHGNYKGITPIDDRDTKLHVESDPKIMETMAAGWGLVHVTGTHHDYFQQFADNLDTHTQLLTVRERYQMLGGDCDDYPRNGYLRKDKGLPDTSIILPVWPTLLTAPGSGMDGGGGDGANNGDDMDTVD